MEYDINILESLGQHLRIGQFTNDSLNGVVSDATHVARRTNEDPHLRSLGD
jgi:hypothetical protein